MTDTAETTLLLVLQFPSKYPRVPCKMTTSCSTCRQSSSLRMTAPQKGKPSDDYC